MLGWVLLSSPGHQTLKTILPFHSILRLPRSVRDYLSARGVRAVIADSVKGIHSNFKGPNLGQCVTSLKNLVSKPLTVGQIIWWMNNQCSASITISRYRNASYVSCTEAISIIGTRIFHNIQIYMFSSQYYNIIIILLVTDVFSPFIYDECCNITREKF